MNERIVAICRAHLKAAEEAYDEAELDYQVAQVDLKNATRSGNIKDYLDAWYRLEYVDGREMAFDAVRALAVALCGEEPFREQE